MSPRKKENRKKRRKVEFLPLAEHRYVIFCEGEKTEPLYFTGMKRAIESNPVYRHMIRIEIHGIGAETLNIIGAAEKEVHKEGITNAQIWCVYDKDDFPADRFNMVSERASELNRKQSDVEYRVAWSNQCIEYWFILHFDYYDSDNDRKYYRKYLHNKFRQLGWPKYEKNNEELFIILSQHGNPRQAIKWARQRIIDLEGYTDAESAPATRVHELIEELSKFLPDEIRLKYSLE